MSYGRYNYYDDDPIKGIVTLGVLYMILMYFADRAKFWHWVIYILVFCGVVIGCIFLWHKLRGRLSWNKMVNKIDQLSTEIPEETNYIPYEANNYVNEHITPEAQALHDALIRKGIKCKLEQWDGHKHIDISIPWARIDIEVDGMQHYMNVKQMTSDLNRSYYSAHNGYRTIRIPNQLIESNLDEVAETITRTARVMYFRSRRNKN